MENHLAYPLQPTLLPRDHALLKQIAKAVPDLFEVQFQSFIDALIVCGEINQGVGIASPQVGSSLRMFIMASKPNSRYPDAPPMQPTAIINPTVLWRSEEQLKGWEGCLSVPGLRGQVPRSRSIRATWYDRFGVFHEQTFTDFMARLFQHEFDHLEGILYPDRMHTSDQAISLAEYAQLTEIHVAS
jgi:peptide deformylase